jgi:hypothetical protein
MYVYNVLNCLRHHEMRAAISLDSKSTARKGVRVRVPQGPLAFLLGFPGVLA